MKKANRINVEENSHTHTHTQTNIRCKQKTIAMLKYGKKKKQTFI